MVITETLSATERTDYSGFTVESVVLSVSVVKLPDFTGGSPLPAIVLQK